jgi:hypothetical protein
MKKNIFCVPLFVYQCTNWGHKKLLLNELYGKIQDNVKLVNKVYTDFSNKKEKVQVYNSQVESIFEDEIGLLKKELGIDYNYRIINSWFEVAEQNNYHNIHTHGDVGYSAVCFINFNLLEHSSTIFLSQYKDPITGKDISFQDPSVEEGTIIFFPSSLQHFTRPNTSHSLRKVISFNLRFIN